MKLNEANAACLVSFASCLPRIWMTKRATELDGKCSFCSSPAVCCVDCILLWYTLWGADFQYELVNAIQYSRMLSLYEPFYDDFPIKTLFFINNLIYNIYIIFPKMIFENFKNIILIFLRNRNKSLYSYTSLPPVRAWCPLLLRQIRARVPIREFTVDNTSTPHITSVGVPSTTSRS